MLERKRGELNIKKLGEIIKIARNKLNLTLSDLSRISDISEIELWLIENGKIKKPKCVFLFRLSNILNLDYNELLKYRFASFKDLGKKCFAINEFNDKEYLDKLLNTLDV